MHDTVRDDSPFREPPPEELSDDDMPFMKKASKKPVRAAPA